MSTSVPVLLALGPAADGVAQGLGRPGGGVVVVRACADLADLLACATTGQARAVLLSATLPGLDREAVRRLNASGVAVVALAPAGDERAERRLRQLGLRHVLPAGSHDRDLATALRRAVAALDRAPAGYADPAAALQALFAPADEEPEDAGHGRVLAVWGPTGAPGRTTVATGLAAELALLGWPALLVDADVYGGTVAALLDLPDEASGLAAACRLANRGLLDVPGLAELAVARTAQLRVLTGLDRAERWAELTPGSVEVVLRLARALAAVTVVDCGFCLEQDEELSYDTLAPRRNGATLAVLEQADLVLAVGSADPVGLQRLVRAVGDLAEAAPDAQVAVVVNRLRPGALPGDAEAHVRSVLDRYAGVRPLAVLPADGPALDAAAVVGRPVVEVAPASPARLALADLALRLVGQRAPERRRRTLLRR